MEKKFFSNFQICHNQFLYFNTQPVGAGKLQCAQFLQNQFYFCSLFTGTLDKFVPYAAGLFMPKKSKLFTREGRFRVFLKLQVENHNKNYNI